MAQEITVRLVDDIDGEPADETVTFGLGRRSYVIDLSAARAEELREILAPYVEAGRRARPVQRTASRPRTDPAVSAAREWLTDRGYGVKSKGRIPKALMNIYQFETGH